MLDAIALERLGVPTVTIVGDQFMAAARLQARIHGHRALPLLCEPTFEGRSRRREVDRFVAAHLEDIVALLLTPVAAGGEGP